MLCTIYSPKKVSSREDGDNEESLNPMIISHFYKTLLYRQDILASLEFVTPGAYTPVFADVLDTKQFIFELLVNCNFKETVEESARMEDSGVLEVDQNRDCLLYYQANFFA